MASNTQIHCGCGATINSAVPELINNFDNLHGNPQHQLLLLQLRQQSLEIKKEVAEIGRTKWGVLKSNGI